MKILIAILLCSGFLIVAGCNAGNKPGVPISTTANVGQQFTLGNLVDTTGRSVSPDFSGAEITIIDFWNTLCPPCIAEMKQFPALIKGKESKIAVISLSVDQFWNWQQIVKEHKGSFAFLESSLSNWKQLNLLTKDNPRFKNLLSSDRLVELDSLYGIHGNPAYFVVDRTGKILSRPVSAVAYLQQLAD